MNKSRHSDSVDNELLELFGDDPAALAIVDAIVATQRVGRPKSRRLIRAACVGAAVIGTAIAIGALTRSSSHAGVIDDALAAIPTDRVLRLSITDDAVAGKTVDLRSGRSRPVRHELTEWFDPRNGRLRVRDTLAGIRVSDVMLSERTNTGSFAQQMLARFPLLYRAQLLQAVSSDVRRALLDGEMVYWMRFRTAGPLRAVAISRRTYKPVRAVFAGDELIRWFRVRGFSVLPTSESVPAPHRDRSVKSRPFVLHRSTLSALRASGRVGVARVLTLLGVPSYLYAGPPSRRSVGAWIYGQARDRSDRIRVEEAEGPERAFGWTPPTVALTENGDVYLTHDRMRWVGFFMHAGRYFRVSSPGPQARVIKIARQLAKLG